MASVFSGGSLDFEPVPLDPAGDPFGQLVLDQGGEEAGRRPTLLVGALGELRPQAVHGRQPQFGEHQRQPRRLGLGGGGHGVTAGASRLS